MFNNLLRSFKIALAKLSSSKDGVPPQTFNLTEEEIIEINKTFVLLENYKAHPDVADKMRAGLTAKGLANFASDRIMFAGSASQKDACASNIQKAIAAIGKAYSYYPLPIYLYDMACYFEINEMPA